jgi:pyridinium-3,5-bisthiocarboxylic acid mononucleotide nickel chelatase
MNAKQAIYFDCFSGISGDMILGSLVDLGVDVKLIRKELKKINLKGYKLTSHQVKRNGIMGTKVNVVIDPSLKKRNQALSFTDIKKLLVKSSLSNQVKTDSVEIFRRIGMVEAKIHDTSLDEIHFHEIGAIDSIVDIVGGVISMSLLNIDLVFSSPLNTGEGLVNCEHGVMPVPAPATLKLLEGIPCYSSGTKKELTTPTGAAFIGYFGSEFCSLPKMNIIKSGYGAGSHEIKEMPNLLRVVLGEVLMPSKVSSMKVIETNIDDMNPEFYDHIMSQLLIAGAVDVFLTAVLMKKNRPGTLLTALVSNDKFDCVVRIILEETSTFGVRHYDVDRTELRREIKLIKTSFGKVRIKVGSFAGSRVTVSPEHEDCKKLALKKGIPIKRVYEEALLIAKQMEE